MVGKSEGKASAKATKDTGANDTSLEAATVNETKVAPKRAEPRIEPRRPEPLPFGDRQGARIFFIVLGASLLFGALVAPWWTRGVEVDEEQIYDESDGDDGFEAGSIPGTE